MYTYIYTYTQTRLYACAQVWRYPCQGARDLVVLNAVRPPPGTWVAMNCITLSREGAVKSLLAGGDVDGDLNMAARLNYFAQWQYAAGLKRLYFAIVNRCAFGRRSSTSFATPREMSRHLPRQAGLVPDCFATFVYRTAVQAHDFKALEAEALDGVRERDTQWTTDERDGRCCSTGHSVDSLASQHYIHWLCGCTDSDTETAS